MTHSDADAIQWHLMRRRHCSCVQVVPSETYELIQGALAPLFLPPGTPVPAQAGTICYERCTHALGQQHVAEWARGSKAGPTVIQGSVPTFIKLLAGFTSFDGAEPTSAQLPLAESNSLLSLHLNCAVFPRCGNGGQAAGSIDSWEVLQTAAPLVRAKVAAAFAPPHGVGIFEVPAESLCLGLVHMANARCVGNEQLMQTVAHSLLDLIYGSLFLIHLGVERRLFFYWLWRLGRIQPLLVNLPRAAADVLHTDFSYGHCLELALGQEHAYGSRNPRTELNWREIGRQAEHLLALLIY